MARITATRHVLAVQGLLVSQQYSVDALGFSVDQALDGWVFLQRDTCYPMLGHCPEVIAAGAETLAGLEDKPWACASSASAR